MVPMRRVVRPVRVSVVRRGYPDVATGLSYTVKLCKESHYIRNMLDDVAGDDQVKLVVLKRVRQIAEVVDDVGGRSWVVVQADGPGIFIGAAADVEDLHK